VDVDLSGASSFKGKITCTTFASDLSGTSRCRADVRCQTADIDLSGASRQESNIECKRLDADLSGTSELKGNVKAAKFLFDIAEETPDAKETKLKVGQLEKMVNAIDAEVVKPKAGPEVTPEEISESLSRMGVIDG
jgi:hypothetical protein